MAKEDKKARESVQENEAQSRKKLWIVGENSKTGKVSIKDTEDIVRI